MTDAAPGDDQGCDSMLGDEIARMLLRSTNLQSWALSLSWARPKFGMCRAMPGLRHGHAPSHYSRTRCALDAVPVAALLLCVELGSR